MGSGIGWVGPTHFGVARLRPCRQEPPCTPWLLGQSCVPPDHVCWVGCQRSMRGFYRERERAVPRPTWHPPPTVFGFTRVRRDGWWRVDLAAMACHLPDATIRSPTLRSSPWQWGPPLLAIKHAADGPLFSGADRRYPEVEAALPPLLARDEELSYGFAALRATEGGDQQTRIYVFGLLAGEDVSPAASEWEYEYRWHSTATLFDGPVTQAAFGLARGLQTWFDQVLLGKAMGGRPTGTGEFRTSEEFVKGCEQAALRPAECGSKITQEALAQSLGVVRGGIRVSRETFAYWREKYGFETWAELRDHIRRATRAR